MTAQLGFGLKLAKMELSWLSLLQPISPDELSSKDLLVLSYARHYLPGKQSTINAIQYIIIVHFRYRFS